VCQIDDSLQTQGPQLETAAKLLDWLSFLSTQETMPASPVQDKYRFPWELIRGLNKSIPSDPKRVLWPPFRLACATAAIIKEAFWLEIKVATIF
jgi:hypothetical protein